MQSSQAVNMKMHETVYEILYKVQDASLIVIINCTWIFYVQME